MPDIATGVAKQVRYKAEATWNTAPGATGAQLLRRVASTLALRKATIQSNEKRRDYQRSDMRHATRSVGGAISGELSPGTYQDFFEAIARQTFQTAATTGALTNVTAAATDPQFTRAAGSFITDGFKVGDIGRWTGWAGGSATNMNSRNFLITALSATTITGIFLDGTAAVADVAGDSVTFAVTGKKTWVPQTGHTDPSFAIEHYHADVTQSELFTGCKLNGMDIGLDPSGMASINMDFLGADMTDAGAEYYTTPTGETDTGILAPANGALYVAGTRIAIVTGLSLKFLANMAATPVVGRTTYPAIFEGRVLAEGQFSAYFQDGTLRDYFADETEISLFGVFTDSNDADADFVSFVFPRIKIGSADKDDPETGIVQTLPFTALLNVAGGTATTLTTLKSTFSIQDSQAT